MFRIFIGYDERESIAYHTLCNSILRHSSKPVSITPLNLRNLDGVFQRPKDVRQSNTFSFSRFLVPFLCGYQGQALYMDCDMLARCDIVRLFEDYSCVDHAVSVVKHDYQSKVDVKYLGNRQYNYPRKNWSSLVLWNCAHTSNKVVSPKFVENEDPATLHRFMA